MQPEIKIVGIVGSLRQASYNGALMRAAQELVPDGVTIEVADISKLPLFDQDIESNVPEEVKKKRLDEIVKLQNKLSLESNQHDIGKTFKVLIEGNSKRSDQDWMGRNSQNKVIVFPKENHALNKGHYVMVKVYDCTGATLLGKIEA